MYAHFCCLTDSVCVFASRHYFAAAADDESRLAFADDSTYVQFTYNNNKNNSSVICRYSLLNAHHCRAATSTFASLFSACLLLMSFAFAAAAVVVIINVAASAVAADAPSSPVSWFAYFSDGLFDIHSLCVHIWV